MNIAIVASEQTGIGALGLNLKSIIFQIIAFAIVLWILNKFAIKKFLAVMDERRAELEKGLNQADEAKKELEKAAQKADETLAEARDEADQILSSAHGEAAQLLKDVETKAAQKADRIVKEAREQLGRDVEKARLELKSDTTQLVAQAAGIVLGEKLDQSKDAALIERSLKETK